MIGRLSRRLLQAHFVMLAMTVIVFIGVNVIGNPVDILVPPDADQAERLRVIAQLGLDKPLWQQYLSFLSGALHADFHLDFVRPCLNTGSSTSSNRCMRTWPA